MAPPLVQWKISKKNVKHRPLEKFKRLASPSPSHRHIATFSGLIVIVIVIVIVFVIVIVIVQLRHSNNEIGESDWQPRLSRVTLAFATPALCSATSFHDTHEDCKC